jgi:dihydropteroate synthase
MAPGLALVVLAARQGAAIVRGHDLRALREPIPMCQAMVDAG